MMNKREFVKQREPAWKRFEGLLAKLSRTSTKKVKSKEVKEFSRLFRELANDLAIVRSRRWGEDLDKFLNHLLARGYDAFYRAPPGVLQRGIEFLLGGFPRLLRANIWYFVTSCVLFFLPLGISWAVVQNDPTKATSVVPEAQLQMMKSMYKKRDNESEKDWALRSSEARSMMAGYYINHNTSIAFRAFAVGILLGVGTVYTLLFNGIMLGVISGYVCAEADPDRFLSFVIMHGAFELTAIAVAGAGGLMLGNTFLHPGQRTRWEALKVRGMEAIQIAIGAGVMLFIAALIEGFVSPSPVIPSGLKYLAGAILWILVALYFVLAGRDFRSNSGDAGDER